MQPTKGRRRHLMLPEMLVVLAMFAMIAMISVAFAGLFQLAHAQEKTTPDKLAVTSTVAAPNPTAQAGAAESTALPSPKQTQKYSRLWDIATVIVMLGLAFLALIIAPARQYPIPHKRKHHSVKR